jgi:signal transduction histidine kinase
MFEILNYYSISLFLGGVVAIFSGAAVYFNASKREEGVAWMLLNLSTAIWSFGYFSMIVSDKKQVAFISDQILHYGAILIPIFYLLFILKLVRVFGVYKKVFFSIVPITLFFLIYCGSALYVRDVFPKGPFNFVPDAGPLYIYFTMYFFAVTVFAQAVLYEAIKNAPKEDRTRLWWVFFSSVFGFIGGGSVFFLTFNVPINPYFLPLFAFYPIIITVAILRYKLFNVKIISTELLSGALWIVLLFRTLLSDRLSDQIINGFVFLFTTVFGILLVQSVYREVKQREKIQKLALDLERANDKLQELDKLKSEFLSLASHQLRGPLTAIKGYASEIMEGDFGELPKHLESPVKTIFTSCQSLTDLVEDFLIISRIEQGRMKYEMVKFNLAELATQVLNEIKPNIDGKGLTLNTKIEDAFIFADRLKMKQILANIIDNSIKYTPAGSILVSVYKKNDMAVFSVKDTGVGVKKETIEKLFQKFSRAEDASKANILGTGLGLYLAKQIIVAHGGRIWVESEGEGKGSEFFVELKTV